MFYSPDTLSKRILWALAHDLCLNFEFTVATRAVKITHPIPKQSSNFEANDDGSPGEEFLNRVFEENEGFTSFSPTTSAGSEGNSNSSPSDKTPNSSISSTSNSSGEIQKSNMKKRSSSDEERQGPPERPGKQWRPGPGDISKQKGQRGRRLACHFHLSNKKKYRKNTLTGKKYETCSGPGWFTMHHVK